MVESDGDARYGGSADLRIMEGETETFLKGGPAAVTESLKVLTCIWAGCQPEQTGVPLQSRAVQLESFAVSHSTALIATHAAKTTQTTVDTKPILLRNILFSQLKLKACERAINPLLHF